MTMSTHNRSPWIHQLDLQRPILRLDTDTSTDVAVIGGGIAGVSTAYFLLEKTQVRVALIERHRLAHGATGHNAGLVVADFERPLIDIEKEFGAEATAWAAKAIDDAWLLLDEMYDTAGLSIPFSRFVEATGLVDVEQVIDALEETDFRRRNNLRFDAVQLIIGKVDETVVAGRDASTYEWVSEEDALAKLETSDTRYIAVFLEPAGTVNSALFCQEIVRFLLERHPDRFTVYEETKVGKLVAQQEGGVILDCGDATCTTKRVVLCTNGFEDFTIITPDGLELDKRFHKNVRGMVNYMSGYVVPMDAPAAGLVYMRKTSADPIDQLYYYLTRRPFEYEKGNGPRHNLISIGGPQEVLEDHITYSFRDGYPEDRAEEIQNFLRDTYAERAPKPDERAFAWHGLLGYTPGMIRIVGSDPTCPDVMYNLGCNGIGILPSIFGGARIAAIVSGEPVKPSIFDPRA